MAVNITSTTDSEAEVLSATGGAKPKEESKVDTKSESSSNEPGEILEASDASELEASDENESEDQEDQGDEEDSKDNETKPKKKGGFKKRIEKFQKQLSKKEAEIEHWKKEALKGAANQAAQPKAEQDPVNAPKVPVEGKPNENDFSSHAEYVEALTDWKLDQREKEREFKSKEAQVKSEFQKTIDTFHSRVSEFKKSTEDYDDVTGEVGDIKLSIAVTDSIITSDIGPQLWYELAKNPKELERINSLNSFAAAKEIGRLEARLSNSIEPKEETKQKTKAPPPLKAVGSRSTAASQKSPDDMTLGEYKKWREQSTI